MKSIFSTTATYWQLPLRLCLFFIFWMHGAQKVLGMYHGPGLQGFVGYLSGLGVPAFMGYLAAFSEFLGALGMLVGFLTRIAAFGLMANMAYAIVAVHAKWGFFMNWGGEPGRGHGYEYPLTLFCMALAVFIGGGGNLSIDRMIPSKQNRPG
jgi:putative oxidoreductase